MFFSTNLKCTQSQAVGGGKKRLSLLQALGRVLVMSTANPSREGRAGEQASCGTSTLMACTCPASTRCPDLNPEAHRPKFKTATWLGKFAGLGSQHCSETKSTARTQKPLVWGCRALTGLGGCDMRAFSDVSSDAADIGRQLYWPKAGLHKTGGGQRLFFTSCGKQKWLLDDVISFIRSNGCKN